jgi:hypothetical protein
MYNYFPTCYFITSSLLVLAIPIIWDLSGAVTQEEQPRPAAVAWRWLQGLDLLWGTANSTEHPSPLDRAHLRPKWSERTHDQCTTLSKQPKGKVTVPHRILSAPLSWLLLLSVASLPITSVTSLLLDRTCWASCHRIVLTSCQNSV